MDVGDSAARVWQWVKTHRDELTGSSPHPRSEAVDALANVLHEYDCALGFELLVKPEGELEITITACGRQDGFASVEALVYACPDLPGVKARAFRQEEDAGIELTVGDHVFAPKSTCFEPMKERTGPGSVRLLIFIPNADDLSAEERLRAARMMIQAILGEYEAAIRIDHIEVANVHGADVEQDVRLSDVAKYLSWYEKQDPRRIQ